jgi:Mg2+-importing ATPase
LAKKNVIVKRIDAIQNLCAMDALCTYKNGTLTMDKVILERHSDVLLREHERVLALTVAGYVVLTQAAKMVLLRRGWI